MYHIDGSTGGGSILRIAIPVALAQKRAINILNIRKSRSKPGLRAQHLAGLQLLCDITGSNLKGGEVGSEEVRITAGHKSVSEIELEIQTAGSLSLVYQLLSNYCLMANKSIRVNFRGGGTHTQWSPNFDYLEQITIPALEQFGQSGTINVKKLGYYPKGGAIGCFEIIQNSIPGDIQWKHTGKIENIHVISRASTNLKNARVAERQLEGLIGAGIDPVSSKISYDQTRSIGTSITVWVRSEVNKQFLGFSALGKKGVPAEQIGKTVGSKISENKHTSVDEYLADQLILALSQSKSGSKYPVPKMTDHVGSNFNLINYMLDKPVAMKQENGRLILVKN